VVFRLTNNGNYGCAASPPAQLHVDLTGQVDASLDFDVGPVPCPSYIDVEVTSLVSAPPGGSVSASGIVYGVVQPFPPQANASDMVMRCADFTVDGTVTIADVLYAVQRFGSGDLSADLNGDGVITVADVLAAVRQFGTFCWNPITI
jgi:hypothetical protein